MSEGRFQDDDGHSAHFDGDTFKQKETDEVKRLRVDFHVAIAQLARNVGYHAPKLIVGQGQAALIALGYARPYFLERLLQTRNVQVREAGLIASAWGKVCAV